MCKRNKSDTRIYQAYSSMVHRCYSIGRQNYKYYGGRGIKICDRWKDSFENFYEDMGERPDGKTLDRIDNDGDYTPENCRWATRKEQQRNTRKNVMLTYNGRTQCIAAWAEEYGLHPSILHGRLYKCGWSVERALVRPVGVNGGRPTLITFRGKTRSIKDWSMEVDINASTIRQRLHRKWTVEKALTTPARTIEYVDF